MVRRPVCRGEPDSMEVKKNLTDIKFIVALGLKRKQF
jgi:hypothetical protein